MGKVFLAGKESEERTALQRHVIADRATQHRVACLERVEDRALGHGTVNLELQVATDLRQRPQVRREARLESCQRLHFDRQHCRKVPNNRCPAVSGIGGGVDLAAGGAEVHTALVERVDCHGVAQHVDVAILLRQAFGERLPLISSRTAAKDAKLARRADSVRHRS